MSTHDADDLVPTDPATTTDVPSDATDTTDTTDQSLTTEEEPTMSGTTPPRASAWTTDTSTLDQPVADETPTAAYAADPTATAGPTAAPAAAPTAAPTGTPVGTVPFPRTLDQPRGIRVGTVVWGLVVTAVAVGLLALANGATFDVQLATIVVIAGAGLALLVGSLVGTRRRPG